MGQDRRRHKLAARTRRENNSSADPAPALGNAVRRLHEELRPGAPVAWLARLWDGDGAQPLSALPPATHPASRSPVSPSTGLLASGQSWGRYLLTRAPS